MKMTKKVLFGAAILAMVFGFASCKNEDDDPEGAIKGSNNDYTVFYDNTNGYSADKSADAKDAAPAGVYRAWKRTSLKHLGALTKITLKAGKDTGSVASNAGKNSGVMGFAWDLQTAAGGETSSDSTAENFNVVGIRNYNGTLQAYVSRFYNITNKQNNNFGVATANSKTTDFATVPPTDASEYDVSGGFKSLGITPNGAETTIWVDVAIVPPTTASDGDKAKCGTASTRALSEYTSAAPGSWVIAIYDSDPKTATSNLTPKGKWVINAKTASAAGSGYDASTINLSTSQKKQAVYANIYKGATLSGAWNYADTYFKVEPVVDAE